MHGLVSFLRCRRGGAMLYSGAFGLMLMAGIGATMTNLAWREAQQEELRGALRASISASSRLLSDASDASVQAQIRTRVANFVRGLADGLEVDDSDITITHNTTTQETWITIGGSAKYAFSNLWGSGGGGAGTVQLPAVRVGVALDSSRYEIAVAADVSNSMRFDIGGGPPYISRIAGLQSALGVAIDVLEDQVTETPGSMAAAIVPFGHTVNVADTSGSGQTEGKRRYARILTGAAVTSTSVSDAAKATTNHYYDLYASYGRGMIDMTAITSKKLPITESTPDWDLRAAESVDVSAIMPSSGATWSTNGKDFWNGCVMARWGAYWDAAAQPSAWNSTNLDNNASLYPATTNVAAWGTGGTALTGQPLHISDDPPSAASPSTRFTAYSYPDSSIGGTADARMEALLKETLTDNSIMEWATKNGGLVGNDNWGNATPILARMRGFNDWGRDNQRAETADGDAMCSSNPILPLTDDATALRTYTNQLTHIPEFGGPGPTYLHLGIVWGTRVLSPLWKSVWNVEDAQGSVRPLAPCYGNNTTNCAQLLKKTLVILSDGQNSIGVYAPMHGRAARGRLDSGGVANVKNPRTNEGQYALCSGTQDNIGMLPLGAGGNTWKTAANDKTAAAFNGRFTGKLDSNGTFSTTASAAIASDWTTIVDSSASSATVNTLVTLLTPWQLFRGETATISNTTCSISDVLAGKTPSGCGWSGGVLASDGRITQRPPCRPHVPFGAYGNVDDFMRIGNQDVVSGASPLQSESTWNLDTSSDTMRSDLDDTLDDWLSDACDFANDRGIAIVGVFIGNSNLTQAINALEACVDRAGGTSGVQDVHIAPTKAALETAFREIFTIRSNVRFLN